MGKNRKEKKGRRNEKKKTRKRKIRARGRGEGRRHGKEDVKNKRTVWDDSSRVQALIQDLFTWHTAHGEQALH